MENKMNTESTTQEVITQEGVWVEIARITVPEDARKHTSEDIDSRAASLAKEGQLENILLSKEGDQLVLVYGNGRLESARKAGWEKIRADIKEGLTETQKLLMTLAENEEREDASPFYTASLYKRLMDTEGLTQVQLADRMGKTQQLIAQYGTLMGVPLEVRQNTNAFVLSLRQCLAIAKLTQVEDELQVMQECAQKGLSGQALEKRVQRLLNPKPAATEAPEHQNKESQPFQFAWKGNGLLIKARLYQPHAQAFNVYLNELNEAYERFMEEEKTRMAA